MATSIVLEAATIVGHVLELLEKAEVVEPEPSRVRSGQKIVTTWRVGFHLPPGHFHREEVIEDFAGGVVAVVRFGAADIEVELLRGRIDCSSR